MSDFFNTETGAFVHSFEPIRVYFYAHKDFPYSTLNPLAKSLLFDDPRYFEWSHLFELAENHADADFIVFPADLNFFENRSEELQDLLVAFKGNAERHVFFDHRDTPLLDETDDSVRFCVSLKKSQVSKRVICIPYMEMVDNFLWFWRKPRTWIYPFSFLGDSTEFRKGVISELRSAEPDAFLKLRSCFYRRNYMSFRGEKSALDPIPKSDNKINERKEFISVCRDSRFILALKGYGLNSFRFFEALSMGIPPVIVSHNCALPFEEEIDYESFSIIVDSSDYTEAAAQILKKIDSISGKKYNEMCRNAITHFHTYFSTTNFLYFAYESLNKIRVK